MHHLGIEPRDTFRRAGAYIEADIGHAELDAAEALHVGFVDVDAVAPWADRLDAVVALAEIEFGIGERLAHALKPLQERRAVRDNQADNAAHLIGLAHRQMELAHADIDPHIAGAGIEERIARQAEPGDVKMRGEMLIADADIDVAEIDDVADVLRGAVVVFFVA